MLPRDLLRSSSLAFPIPAPAHTHTELDPLWLVSLQQPRACLTCPVQALHCGPRDRGNPPRGRP